MPRFDFEDLTEDDWKDIAKSTETVGDKLDRIIVLLEKIAKVK